MIEGHVSSKNPSTILRTKHSVIEGSMLINEYIVYLFDGHCKEYLCLIAYNNTLQF